MTLFFYLFVYFSDDEETFVGSVLEGYSESGHPLVYIGGSDIGHDDLMKWWDQTSIGTYYWGQGMPQNVAGKLQLLKCVFLDTASPVH